MNGPLSWPELEGEPTEHLPDAFAGFAPDLVCLQDVQARPVSWLWEPFIPRAMMTMLSGDPGSGKSFIALSLAADLTRGKLRDGRIVEPQNVLYLSIENPVAESVRPRFDSLGGDPSRFFMLRGKSLDGERLAVILSDIDLLRVALRQTGARLLVVDPIQSYLGSAVDLHRSNETRPVMDGLGRLAEETDCAILILRHLSKMGGGKAIHRGLGSIDLTGSVRSELLAGSLPDDPETRALVHVKSNVGRLGKAQGYRIDADGTFSWLGESTLTAGDLLAAPAGPGDRKFVEAATWLSEILRDGPRPQKAIQEQAEQDGFAYRTIRRAKESLSVRSFKESVRGPWMWELPKPVEPEHGQEGHQDVHTKKLAPLGKLAPLEEGQEVQRKSFIFPRRPNNVFGHLRGHLGSEQVYPVPVPEGAGDAWEPPGPVDVSFPFGWNTVQ